MRTRLLIGALLAVVTLVLFSPVRDHGFLNLDDGQYVTGNLPVRAGLTWEGVEWAFTTSRAHNWHPLTWLSLMLDVELFGLDAGALHTMNLLLHVANTLLLFALLDCVTGAAWRSGFVAALFALHPLHIESVAWIAERKDVLSTLFWLGASLAYVGWARRRSPAAYALALVLMAFGLMAKPMLVTLPCALLLMDVWPLRRLEWSESLRPRKVGPLVLEKLPFFALAAASSVITASIQDTVALDKLSLVQRTGNSLVSYVRYLSRTFWPTDQAIFYPHPLDWPLWQVGGAALLLAALTVGALLLRRRAPYVLAGWLFYLGVLVPTIGLVQVGGQSMADRYTYIPLIGIFWIVAWGAHDLLRGTRRATPVLAVGACVVLIGCSAVTHRYLGRWQSSVSIFEHALRSTRDNQRAHNLLAEALLRAEEPERAMYHVRESLRLRPTWAAAHELAGDVQLARGDLEGAASAFRRAVRLDAAQTSASVKLGGLLEDEGDLAGAEVAYRAALESDPASTRTRAKLGRTLVKQGRLDDAIGVFQDAMRDDPWDPEAYESRAIVAEMQGDVAGAMDHYRLALDRQPHYKYSRSRLGWMLLTARETELRDAAEALEHFELACEHSQWADPNALGGLAAAYAANGRLDEATRTATQASAAARSVGDPAEAERYSRIAEGYAQASRR